MVGTNGRASTPRRGAWVAGGRTLGVAALYAAGVQGLRWAGAGIRSDLQRPGPLPPDVAVEAAGALAAWACLLWWGSAFVATALGALPGTLGTVATRCSEAFAPAVVRRLTRYVLGAALVSGSTAALAAPAGATAAPTPGPEAGFELPNLELPNLDRPGGALGVPVATPTPDPPSPCPAGVPHAAHRHGVRAKPVHTARVVVRPGDTLWGIAARHLGPTASTARVAAAWPRWYRANADAVGADPDLIQPGLRLRLAPAAEETR